MRVSKVAHFAIVLSVGLVAACDQIRSPETIFLNACEAELKSRLSAPSTFHLIERRALVTELSRLEWESEDPSSSGTERDWRKKFYGDGQSAKKYVATVQYEAANTYGTPIAATSVCSLVSMDAKEDLTKGTAAVHALKVDGQTKNDLMEAEFESVTGLHKKY